MGEYIFHGMRSLFGDAQGYDSYKIGIRLTILFMYTSLLIGFDGITIYGIPEGERSIYRLIHYSLAILFPVSYYRGTYAQPLEIPQLNSIPEDQYCELCNAWKPKRTRHCRVCRKGVPKMDHHCPWVANCIGYQNQKFFFLFNFYAAWGGWQYVDTSIRFSFFSGLAKELWMPYRMFYWMMNVLLYPITLMLTNLFANGLLLAYNNLTTIDTYMRKEMNCPGLPRGLEKIEYIEQRRNQYDRLWMNNLCDLMGDKFWKWPLPILFDMEGKGFYYPTIPDFEMSDLQSITNNNQHVEQTFEINESEESVHRYAKAALLKYKGQQLMAEDKIFELPENHPDMPNASFADTYDDSD